MVDVTGEKLTRDSVGDVNDDKKGGQECLQNCSLLSLLCYFYVCLKACAHESL